MQRRGGSVSMLRLKKSDESADIQDLVKRAMSMMRLRRDSWERSIRGPSMMRLKRVPLLKEDVEPTLCTEYPNLC